MDDGSEFSEYWKSSSSVKEDIRQAFKVARQGIVSKPGLPLVHGTLDVSYGTQDQREFTSMVSSPRTPQALKTLGYDDLWFAWGLLEESGEM
ncbi:hypothetical protein AWENTII_000813 [Aspergillus wentii]